MQEWQDYIDALHNVKDVTNEVLQFATLSHGLLNNDTETKIRKLQDDNNILLEKLENKIFEIVVIGSEKAGQSTFINALTDSLILPSSAFRCTFTSTQLEYGEDEDAVIEFYTIDEFNFIFRSLLKLLKFANSENISYDTFELNRFEEHMKSLDGKDAQRQLHAGRAEEDIRGILNGKDIIKFYIGLENMKFSKEQLAKKEDWEKFITDKYISRAVKKFRIRSGKLNSMKSAVIIDISGFDYPSEIYRTDIIKHLKSADAVILLANIASNPGLRGTDLNLLAQKIDSAGIAIKDKLFVFGNHIDRVHHKQDIPDHINILLGNVSNRLAVNTGRIFTGSALAYLVNKKIDTQNVKVLDNFNNNEIECFGIDEIRKELEKQCEKRLFNVTKTIINRNILNIKEAFDKLLAEQVSKDKFIAEEISKYCGMDKSLFINFVDIVTDKIANSFGEIKNELKSKIEVKKYFTVNINSQISGVFKKLDIEEIDSMVNMDCWRGFFAKDVNRTLRFKIYTDFLTSFEKLIADLIEQKYNEIHEQILETFLNVILESSGIKKDESRYEELKQASETLLIKLIGYKTYDRNMFMLLVERFSGCLLDVVIRCPLGSSERFDSFISNKPIFLSLALFDNIETALFPVFASPLINIVLSHKTYKPRTFTEWIKESVLGFDVIENKYFESLIKQIEHPVTPDDVLEEINADIVNLIEIFKNSVIKVIGLESAFTSIISRQLKAIIDAIKRDHYKRPLYTDFLAGHANDLYPEIKNIQNENAERIKSYKAIAENRKNMVSKLRELIEKMAIQKFDANSKNKI